MTAHSFCMLQLGHNKKVKSPLKHQLPPYVGANPSCQIWHSAPQLETGIQRRSLSWYCTRDWLRRLQLTLMMILCMDLPTSQRMGTETLQPQSRKLLNTTVNSHWLNSGAVHLYTAEIRDLHSIKSEGACSYPMISRRISAGWRRICLPPTPRSDDSAKLRVEEQSEGEVVSVLFTWEKELHKHNWSIIGQGREQGSLINSLRDNGSLCGDMEPYLALAEWVGTFYTDKREEMYRWMCVRCWGTIKGSGVGGGRVVGRGWVRQVETGWLGLSRPCFSLKTRGKLKGSDFHYKMRLLAELCCFQRGFPGFSPLLPLL